MKVSGRIGLVSRSSGCQRKPEAQREKLQRLRVVEKGRYGFD